MIKESERPDKYAYDKNNYKKFGVVATNLEIRFMLNHLPKIKKQKKLDFIKSERESLKAIEAKMVQDKWLEIEKEYSSLFNLVFNSKIKADKVSYQLLVKNVSRFETKEKNGQYIAVRPCPKVCTSSSGSPKFLYNRMGIKALTLADKKKLEEYDCPYGVGYHLRSINPKNYF